MKTPYRFAAAVLAVGALSIVAASAEESTEAPSPGASILFAPDANSPPVLLQLFAGEDGVGGRILETRSGNVRDSLWVDGSEPASAPSAWIQDLNFDGHLDVALPAWAGATGNVGYAVWLYAPATGHFTKNELLSGTSQLTPDPERRELTSHWNGGHAGAIYVHETIGCPQGVPTVVRREKVDWDGRVYAKTVESLREGKLVTTSQTQSAEAFEPPERR